MGDFISWVMYKVYFDGKLPEDCKAGRKFLYEGKILLAKWLSGTVFYIKDLKSGEILVDSSSQVMIA